MPDNNRIAGMHIYVADAPQTPIATKLYNALISFDAEFCIKKVNGSITLHYNSGQLSKIHVNNVI